MTTDVSDFYGRVSGLSKISGLFVGLQDREALAGFMLETLSSSDSNSAMLPTGLLRTTRRRRKNGTGPECGTSSTETDVLSPPMDKRSSTSASSFIFPRTIVPEPSVLPLVVIALMLVGTGCTSTTEVTRNTAGYGKVTEAASGETARVFLRDGQMIELIDPYIGSDSTVGRTSTGERKAIPTSAVREIEIANHRKGAIQGSGLGAIPLLIGILGGVTRERGINEVFVTDLIGLTSLVTIPVGGYLGYRKGAGENYRLMGPPSEADSVPSPPRAERPVPEEDTSAHAPVSAQEQPVGDDTTTTRADSTTTGTVETAKLPGTALTYSLGGTIALTPVFGVGLVVGPSFGHFYADANERAWQGMGVRGGLLLVSVAIGYLAPEGSGAVWISTAGILAIPVHAIYDSIKARDSALDYNRTHGVRAHVAPTVNPHRKQVGLALRVSF